MAALVGMLVVVVVVQTIAVVRVYRRVLRILRTFDEYDRTLLEWCEKSDEFVGLIMQRVRRLEDALDRLEGKLRG